MRSSKPIGSTQASHETAISLKATLTDLIKTLQTRERVLFRLGSALHTLAEEANNECIQSVCDALLNQLAQLSGDLLHADMKADTGVIVSEDGR